VILSQPVPCGVLLVEDDEGLREMMTQLLHLEGYDPLPAPNGAEALRMLRTSYPLPRVILLDLMMPVMDGWQFRRELRGDPYLTTIPVIVLSAVAKANPTIDAAAVLSKPFDFELLLSTLRIHVSDAAVR
jgi:CheY-like chemotaxis protein